MTRGDLSDTRLLLRDDVRDQPAYWSAHASGGMVATAHYRATAIAADVLSDGGNAIDGAIAAALALAVCESAGSGIGGMAMMLLHLADSGRTVLIEGACQAPASATPEAVSGSHRYHGYRAVAIPGQLAVLDHARRRYGTQTLGRLIEPAIELADEGFPLTPLQVGNVRPYLAELRRSTAAPFFLDEDGAPHPAGTQFRQPVLGATLRRLEVAGLDDFYRGAIARDIAEDMHAHAGFLSEADLAGFTVREVAPIEGVWEGTTIQTAGPPAGGATLVQILHTLEALPEPLNLETPRGAVLMASIISRARRDRRRFRLQTGTDDLGAAAELLSPEYARRAASEIVAELESRTDANRRAGASGPSERSPGETTHLCVMDRAGNTVSHTQSIERSFGAAVVTPSLGFLYNGYLRAFKVANERHPHFLRPGAPARSNAAPTIGLRNGRPWLAIGSSGSERMSSGIAQVLARLKSQDPFAAVHAPRLHATPTRGVLAEVDRMGHDSLEALQEAGFTIEPLDPYSFDVGGLQLVLRQDDGFVGVAEPRRDGAAAGPDEPGH